MKTAVIEGRLDVRDLATCADYFIMQGEPATSKSNLMSRVLTTFAFAASTQGARAFEETEDALSYLFSVGLGPVNRMIRGKPAGQFSLSKTVEKEKIHTEEDFQKLAREIMKKMEPEQVFEVDDVDALSK
jgi:SpoVK/Ycf46/Vps4 family AAA+-type ATPase